MSDASRLVRCLRCTSTWQCNPVYPVYPVLLIVFFSLLFPSFPFFSLLLPSSPFFALLLFPAGAHDAGTSLFRHCWHHWHCWHCWDGDTVGTRAQVAQMCLVVCDIFKKFVPQRLDSGKHGSVNHRDPSLRPCRHVSCLPPPRHVYFPPPPAPTRARPCSRHFRSSSPSIEPPPLTYTNPYTTPTAHHPVPARVRHLHLGAKARSRVAVGAVVQR